MYLTTKERPECIITFDWKEQPPWLTINDAIRHVMSFKLTPVIIPFETGDDEHAIMVAPQGFNAEVAKTFYDNQTVFFQIP